jgi:hypothetical protein
MRSTLFEVFPYVIGPVVYCRRGRLAEGNAVRDNGDYQSIHRSTMLMIMEPRPVAHRRK